MKQNSPHTCVLLFGLVLTGSNAAFPCSLESHVVEIEVVGPGQKGNNFSVKTVRNNPASAGAVTGKQTYGSFSSSLFGKTVFNICSSFIFDSAGAVGKGKGVHLC